MGGAEGAAVNLGWLLFESDEEKFSFRRVESYEIIVYMYTNLPTVDNVPRKST